MRLIFGVLSGLGSILITIMLLFFGGTLLFAALGKVGTILLLLFVVVVLTTAVILALKSENNEKRTKATTKRVVAVEDKLEAWRGLPKSERLSLIQNTIEALYTAGVRSIPKLRNLERNDSRLDSRRF